MPAYDKLHASGEDYVEAILILQQKQGMVRSVDVARCMEVSKPSVCHAVGVLREGGFRQVPMSAAACEAFKRVLENRKGGKSIQVDGYSNFLFLNRDGLPKVAVNYDAMFKCLAKKFNKCHKEPLPSVMTPHTMRHTFCTRMANAGMNPKALQYIMGHANIVMTLNYYAHTTFHSAQEEMDRLEAKAEIKVVNTEKIEAAA